MQKRWERLAVRRPHLRQHYRRVRHPEWTARAERTCRLTSTAVEGLAVSLFSTGEAEMGLFNWFESRLDPYPAAEPEQPPKGLVAFCLHYSKGAKKWLVAMACLSATVAAGEIVLFGFLGSIVDWLGSADRATFLANEGWKLAGMAAFLLFLLVL